jgi:hypothetical protein
MTLRDLIVANALWGCDNEAQIHYSQGSLRFAALNTPRALPLYTDCSGFVTLCYKWAGAQDPNNLGYNGSGFTGTLLTGSSEISLAEALPGDLIVYGPGAGDHVVIIVEPGDDPLTVSHGQERGPFLVRHSVEARAHRAPVRVLRGVQEIVAPIKPVPPAQINFETEEPMILLHPTEGAYMGAIWALQGNRLWAVEGGPTYLGYIALVRQQNPALVGKEVFTVSDLTFQSIMKRMDVR